VFLQRIERPFSVAFGKRTTPPEGITATAAGGGKRAVLDAETIKAHIANMIKASADIVTFLLTPIAMTKAFMPRPSLAPAPPWLVSSPCAPPRRPAANRCR